MKGLNYHKTKNQLLMKNFITILLLLFLFTFKNATSQVVIKQLEDLADKVRLLKARSSLQHKTNTEIEGTPYLSEDFKSGEVYTNDSILYKGPLRYNIYANEIEFIESDIVYWIAEPQKVIYVKIEKSTFIYIQPGGKKNEKGTYYELLVDGKCKLLLKRNTELIEAEPAKPYIDAKPARFMKLNDTYILQINNGLPQSIVNKKSIENAFSEKSSFISKYIKKEKISTKEKDDLIKLVKYCNSL